MNDKELEAIARDPKFRPSNSKPSKTGRSLKDLFDDVAPEQTYKDKRGRPWLKNPRAYVKMKLATKVSDSESDGESSSEEEETESSLSTDESEVDPMQSIADLQGADWFELTKDAVTAQQSTYRLALLHFDWDNAKPETVYMVLESFLPARGHIEKVTIYPSQYGIDRMNEETEHGPPELRHHTDSGTTTSDPLPDVPLNIDDKTGWRGVSQTMRRRIREYQLSRLKYFYAIIEFDSVETAKAVYDACDGLEYESSGSRLDLRFVDDDQTFEVDPKYAHLVSQCREINKAKYEPVRFETSALRSTRIGITWDKTSQERTNWFLDQFRDGLDPEDTLTKHTDELGKYLALSSSGASTAASSDVDAPPPAPTVPRIPRHRPKKLPPAEVRQLLLAGSSDSLMEQQQSTKCDDDDDDDANDKEEIYDLNNAADGDEEEEYDLGPVEKIASKHKMSSKLGRKSVKRISLPELQTTKSDSSAEEEEQEQDDEDDNSIAEKNKSTKLLKRKKRITQKARILVKKQKLQSKLERQAQLWHIKNPDGSVCQIEDDRFDEFFHNPAFEVSQTHPDYKEAQEFLQFIKSRKSRINITSV